MAPNDDPPPGRTAFWVGFAVDAVYLVLVWLVASVGGDGDIGGGVYTVFGYLLIVSFSAQIVGAIQVARGEIASGGLWAAWGSVLFLVPGIFSLYGARRLRNDAVARALVHDFGGGPAPRQSIWASKAAGRLQALGWAMVVIGGALAVVGGVGGIVATAGAVQIAAGLDVSRVPRFDLYDTFFLWRKGLLIKPAVFSYDEIVDVQEEAKGLRIAMHRQTIVLARGSAEPHEMAEFAEVLRKAAESGRLASSV